MDEDIFIPQKDGDVRVTNIPLVILDHVHNFEVLTSWVKQADAKFDALANRLDEISKNLDVTAYKLSKLIDSFNFLSDGYLKTMKQTNNLDYRICKIELCLNKLINKYMSIFYITSLFAIRWRASLSLGWWLLEQRR